MLGIGTKEIIIIAILGLLLFGPKKIPEITRSVGDAIRHILGAFKDVDKDIKDK